MSVETQSFHSIQYQSNWLSLYYKGPIIQNSDRYSVDSLKDVSSQLVTPKDEICSRYKTMLEGIESLEETQEDDSDSSEQLNEDSDSYQKQQELINQRIKLFQESNIQNFRTLLVYSPNVAYRMFVNIKNPEEIENSIEMCITKISLNVLESLMQFCIKREAENEDKTDFLRSESITAKFVARYQVVHLSHIENKLLSFMKRHSPKWCMTKKLNETKKSQLSKNRMKVKQSLKKFLDDFILFLNRELILQRGRNPTCSARLRRIYTTIYRSLEESDEAKIQLTAFFFLRFFNPLMSDSTKLYNLSKIRKENLRLLSKILLFSVNNAWDREKLDSSRGPDLNFIPEDSTYINENLGKITSIANILLGIMPKNLHKH